MWTLKSPSNQPSSPMQPVFEPPPPSQHPPPQSSRTIKQDQAFQRQEVFLVDSMTKHPT